MQKEARFLGHPIHQMLIVFPLGLFVTSLAFDFAYLETGNFGLAAASYWTLSAGIVGALLAAVFGLFDWINIPQETRAKSVGLWHGVGNVMVTALFMWSWFLRREGQPPPGDAMTLSVLGVLLALVTGWLGGELVIRHGIGVDEDASPNAPSSLSHDERWRASHPH